MVNVGHFAQASRVATGKVNDATLFNCLSALEELERTNVF